MKRILILISSILLFIAVGCSSDKEASVNSENEAADFPKKPIELVVPFAPGGPTDVLSRSIAKELPEHLPNKQQVAVINKDGAGTTLGLSEVASAKADGYKIAITTSSGLDIQPHYGETSYDAESFTPIIKVVDISTALTVKDDSAIKDYDGWLEYVKDNPGKFTYAAPGGTGSSGHIVMEQISEELGIDVKQVPYEGTADIKNAILSGEIDAGFLGPDIDQGGELRPIFFNTTAKGPTDFYEDIPNTTDLNLDAKSDFYVGFIAPKDTPEEVITILHDSIKEIMELPNVKEVAENQVLKNSYENSEDFKEIITNASIENKEVMEELGLLD